MRWVGRYKKGDEDDEDDDEDNNVGMMRMIMLGWMESTVVVYNRQSPITGTVPIFLF